jgi:hypothetical protein
MRLDPRAFALASAILTAISYGICYALFALWPEATRSAVGYVMHVDLRGVPRVMSWDRFLVGFFVWTGFWWVVGAALAGLYNRLLEIRAAAAVRRERGRVRSDEETRLWQAAKPRLSAVGCRRAAGWS